MQAAAEIPEPPTGTRTGGRTLWAAVLDRWELEEHEMVLLREAVRTVDLLDELAEVIERDGLMVGDRTHPAMVESRQQRICLARLLAALRLPDDDGAESRPQRRQTRGVYSVHNRPAKPRAAS